MKTISDIDEEITRSVPAPTMPDASAAPTRPPPPLYPPAAYPEPRIAVMSAPIIIIEELAPETPRVAPSESMVRLATPAHAMPPVKIARATTRPTAPRPSFVPPPFDERAKSGNDERTDERARSSLEAIIMTPGPMIPATLPPVPVKSGRSKWLFAGPCLAMAIGALVGFGFAQRAALPTSRDTSVRAPTFGLARSIVFVRQDTPIEPATMGRIVTRSAELGHRVYIDGRVAGTSGDSFSVTCGRHDVRIGTNARSRYVDVACGASVDIAR